MAQNNKIPKSLWPRIVQEADRGDSFAALGRRYNVSDRAIAYIVRTAKGRVAPVGLKMRSEAMVLIAVAVETADAYMAFAEKPHDRLRRQRFVEGVAKIQRRLTELECALEIHLVGDAPSDLAA